MTRTRAVALWLVSLMLLAISAGQSWNTFELSGEVGGGIVEVSGFEAFPVIGVLIVLQVVAVLLSLLVRPMLTRFITIAITPLMLWNLIDVLSNSASQVQLTFVRALAEQTGVLADSTTSGFLIASSGGVISFFYLGCLALNVLVLVSVAATVTHFKSQSKQRVERNLPEDLWSSQS
jgi:hypothetical protein